MFAFPYIKKDVLHGHRSFESLYVVGKRPLLFFSVNMTFDILWVLVM